MQPNERERRRAELAELLRIDKEKEIIPARQDFAELLLDLVRRKRLMDAGRKPLRALGELAHVAPYRLESLVTSEIWPGKSTIEKLAVLGGPNEQQVLASLGRSSEIRALDDAMLNAADRAVLEAIGAWPDEDKYDLARHLRRVQAIGRADKIPE